MSRVCVLSVLLLVSLTFCTQPACAQTILEIEIQQLTFEDPVAMTGSPPTDIGCLDITYEAGPTEVFLNLRGRLAGDTGPGFWLVRNLYLHGHPTDVPFEQIAVRFPGAEIGMELGVTASALEFAMTLQPQPLLDADYPTWEATNPFNQSIPFSLTTIAVGTESIADESFTTPTYNPEWWKQYLDPGFSVVAHPGCSMSNIELDNTAPGRAKDWNGCVPAACANSLHWLKSQHPEINFPGTLRDTWTELSKLMNRTSPEGVWPKDAARAKLDFAEAHGLPIHVKYQDFFTSGDVSSTSGNSTANDMGGPSQYPTREWLQAEADAGEDIEVNISWLYVDSDGKTKWDGAHALVLTGIGETGGNFWIKLKHDRRQDRTNPDDLAQEESGIIVEQPTGAMRLPKLARPVQRTDGTWTTGIPYITSVVSESFDPFVLPPPENEPFGEYCDLIKRTVPPLGSIDIEWPNDEARCYNATVWAMDRETDPPTLVQQQNWNHNRGKTRTWVNTADYPVTVFIHNDDWQSGSPYPGFNVGVNVNQGPTTGLPSPGNPIMYGGFSIAGRDGSTDGFNPQANGVPFADIGPLGEGFGLNVVPTILDDPVGPRDWRLWTDIPVWNDYWGHLGLVVDVLAVAAPGNIQVFCPNNGFNAPIAVGAPGRFFVDLGPVDPAGAFEVLLTAGPGLSITIDAVGIPSLVTYHGTDAPPNVVRPDMYVLAAPNPFNPRADIHWGIEDAGEVEVAIYDLRGRIVRTLFSGWQEAGPGQEVWDGSDDTGGSVASGVYVVQVHANGKLATTKVSLVR